MTTAAPLTARTEAPSEVRSGPRIVRAELFEIQAEFVKPYRVTEGLLFSAGAILLKLTDADGVVGWGEANPSKTFTGESITDALEALQRIILPALLEFETPAPAPVDRMLDALLHRQLCAKGAVSMALWDILGKRQGASVGSLLGGALRQRIPVLWPLGGDGTVEEDIATIDEKLSEGFSHFMLKVGSAPVADDIGRVMSLGAHFGDRIRLIADANQGWSRDVAMCFVEGVAGSRLEFIEQPLERGDFEGMAVLGRRSRIPISADEAVVGLTQAAELARDGAASVFSLKSSKNGGILRALKIAYAAEAFGIRCYSNSMHEFGVTQAASLQVASVIPNLFDFGHAFMSTLRLKQDPTDFGSFVERGVVSLPEGPGLGITVDEARVAKMSVGRSKLLP